MNDSEIILLNKFTTFNGTIGLKKQYFQYFLYKKHNQIALFIIDPKTQGMSLTNCCEEVVEEIQKIIVGTNIVTKEEMIKMIKFFSIHLRDTNNEWARIGNQNYENEGLKVRVWEHFEFNKEYLKLFSLLG